MTASRRRRPRSPAAGPLEDDDLLREILLRLPPQPSSLPRASAVSRRWRLLVSDPRFSSRFRIRHRRSSPLLGFFDRDLDCSFLPTLEAPNRVPPGRFSLHGDDDGDRFCFRFQSLGCRHGLVLVFDRTERHFLVWDPVSGHRHHVASPPGFSTKDIWVYGAVLRAAGGVHFRVVLIVADDIEQGQRRVAAWVYSSDTGVWGNLISTPIVSQVISAVPAVLVGDSLYWILTRSSLSYHGFHVGSQILELDLEKQELGVIQMPVFGDMFRHGCFTVVQADGGGLGLLVMSKFTAQLWKRKTDYDGIASWESGRTIDLGNLLSLNLEGKHHIVTLRFAEENNLLVLCTDIGIFTVQLQSLQFKKISEYNIFSHYHPFESVYTAETGIGGGQGAAHLLQNT